MDVPIAEAFGRDDYERILSWTHHRGTVIKALHLPDRARTYQEAIGLILSARDNAHIRATVSLFDPDDFSDKLFREYLKSVAKRCGLSAKNNGSFRYDAVFGFNRGESGQIPLHVRTALIQRVKVFRDHRALRSIAFHELSAKWALNILVVDYDDAIIGFPESAQHTKLQEGVRLSGLHVVSPIASWYDKCVQGQATKIDLSALVDVSTRSGPTRRST